MAANLIQSISPSAQQHTKNNDNSKLLNNITKKGKNAMLARSLFKTNTIRYFVFASPAHLTRKRHFTVRNK
jgi:hypothetical protein